MAVDPGFGDIGEAVLGAIFVLETSAASIVLRLYGVHWRYTQAAEVDPGRPTSRLHHSLLSYLWECLIIAVPPQKSTLDLALVAMWPMTPLRFFPTEFHRRSTSPSCL
jgi:hypothetical protein